MEDPDSVAFVQSSKDLLDKLIGASASCPSETLDPDDENLSHYQYNFSRQYRALLSIDFPRAEEDISEELQSDSETEDTEDIEDTPAQHTESSSQTVKDCPLIMPPEPLLVLDHERGGGEQTGLQEYSVDRAGDMEEISLGHRGAEQREELSLGHRGAEQREEISLGHRGAEQREEISLGHRGAEQREETPLGHRGAEPREESPLGHRGAEQTENMEWRTAERPLSPEAVKEEGMSTLQAVTLLFYLLAFLVILQRFWVYVAVTSSSKAHGRS
ncbi:hypothetical protein WMY93_033932 [Mugilogobius chulae]|uniref:COS domain-containing protein n=1 Tax=Mugilogobius chulae TaxID=88201 RepID=A0AAW0MQ91_9GOBI